ncbi:hypothetical protein LshimejAT787_1103940 [Lyophyllum shimeji]|uniref:Uncharacterized protein n=1 Tax=Lyophyllum shimeji TaxID=47721 RepID=A0A9P3PVL7_LYOSH|nr:hypothetical protein LshimejAT787_1103940 [Lyophyllum shimeji]
MSPQPIYLDEKSDEPITHITHACGGPAEDVAEPTPLVPDRRKCRRKKLRFLAAIFLVWLGFKLWSYLRFEFYNRYGYHTVAGVENTAVFEDPPVPDGVELVECPGWQGTDVLMGRHFAPHDRFTSYASFNLPVDSDKLFVLARGSAAGALKVRQGSGSEDVKVEVEARYRFEEAIDSVKVCTVKRGEGENGLGIFGPEWSRRNFVRFEITFYLPEGEKGSVLDVKSFETDAPLFAHDIGDLERSVHFDDINLKSANTPIFVKSLRADNAAFETRNSPISGEFNVSSSLTLITANARIDAKVNLFNEDDGDSTNLVIKTSNARVKGALKLESANKSGGQYQVSASTSNAALDLKISEAPVRHALSLDADTSLGPVLVQVHPTYEGTFDVATSLLRPEIVWKGVEDPEGKGRRRKVEVHTDGSRASGRIRWSDEDPESPGKINVKTSLAPLRLEL